MHPLLDAKELLRGTRPWRAVAEGREGAPSARSLLLACLALGAAYGLCMALYGVVRGRGYGLFHLLAVACKVPALFLLTLAVTAPSLYTFSTLAGSRLSFRATLRLLLAASTASLAVLASFAPVTAFFTFSTRSHPFLQLLNTAAFAVAGVAGLVLLHRGLREARESSQPRTRRERAILWAWSLIHAGVGAQMAWILRPFVGSPGRPQELFRSTEANFLAGLLEALRWL